MPEVANAQPTKKFFIANLTRDLSLEDAILDLVDNSIDALVRTNDLDVSPELVRKQETRPIPAHNGGELPTVTISITEHEFTITDRCGGIELERARKEVFRLGRVNPEIESALGVYGIGLKRAVFKIGKNISIESRTLESGFKVTIDVPNWSANDGDWTFPLEVTAAASSQDEAGTTITIRDLNPEVRMRIAAGTLLIRLAGAISSTYTLFLQHFLAIDLNGTRIKPQKLPIATSTELEPLTRKFIVDGVTVELFAGLAVRVDQEWEAEKAGWYVLCNGRVVLAADKSERTGWGQPGPQYVSKYRGFIGIAFFFSQDPAVLPWTTTKRDLNEESIVYQTTRKEMAQLARPVLTFLNRMYPSDPAPEIQERKLADGLQPVPLHILAEKAETANPRKVFSTAPSLRHAKRTTVSVQYRAEKADIERIKNKIGHPDWGAGSVGRYTFERYMKVEFSE